MAKDRLEKAKDWAHIVATIAVPILVAYFGYQIQSAVKDREIRRDYVQIATGILSSKDSKLALRTWAVEVLSAHSPIALSADLKRALESGEFDLALAQLQNAALWEQIDNAEQILLIRNAAKEMTSPQSKEASQGMAGSK